MCWLRVGGKCRWSSDLGVGVASRGDVRARARGPTRMRGHRGGVNIWNVRPRASNTFRPAQPPRFLHGLGSPPPSPATPRHRSAPRPRARGRGTGRGEDVVPQRPHQPSHHHARHRARAHLRGHVHEPGGRGDCGSAEAHAGGGPRGARHAGHDPRAVPGPAPRARRGGGPAEGVRGSRRAVSEGHPGPAAPHDNFFAVGDDEQSIFTWTGADPYVLVRFARDYGIAQPIVLDKNCRCSRQIFETARRVLAQNPQLFEKRLSAEQESPHEVTALAFRDEAEEASWLLEDLRGDRVASGLRWGNYAILYRKHKIGEYLEGRLLRAGIPCRLARGRSLIEDAVIKYVIAPLRIVRDPDDPIALEAFARCLLSAHFLHELEAAIGASGGFLAAVRAAARPRPAPHPATQNLWRAGDQGEDHP